MYTTNPGCRVCHSSRLTKFLSLGNQPPANSFLQAERLAEPEPTYPLEVYFCHNCHLAQLIDVVDKDELYRDYVYFSSVMPKISAHWQGYAEDVIAKFLTQPSDLVVEIGSNDGVVLKFFQERGFAVLGVDPARNIASEAEKNNVPTIADFFGAAVAQQIVTAHGHAKAILANNVVAHINDHHSLAQGLKVLLAEDGVFVMEAPYIMDMFAELAYDSIYHEHLSFLAVRPLQRLFAQFELEIFDVQLYPVQGNSLRVYAGRAGKHPVLPSVGQFAQKELDWQLDSLVSYQLLAHRIGHAKERLLALLTQLKQDGQRIAGFGAPARGNTVLNYCRIGTNFFDYILDDLPSKKQGMHTPGMHIPVVGKEYALAHPVDYYYLLSWNYRAAILEKEKQFRERGGKFIIPHGDELEIV